MASGDICQSRCGIVHAKELKVSSVQNERRGLCSVIK
jgi:hypothetical protein